MKSLLAYLNQILNTWQPSLDLTCSVYLNYKNTDDLCSTFHLFASFFFMVFFPLKRKILPVVTSNGPKFPFERDLDRP